MKKRNEHGADNVLPVTHQTCLRQFLWIRSVTRVADQSEMNAYIESRKAEIAAKAAKNKAKLVLDGKAELH